MSPNNRRGYSNPDMNKYATLIDGLSQGDIEKIDV